MLKIKKILGASLLAVVTIFTTACGAAEATKETVIQKLIESQDIKSADLDIDTNVKFGFSGINATTSVKGKSSVIQEPLSMSLDMETKLDFPGAGGQNIPVKGYVVDEYLYLNSGEEWVKTKDTNFIETTKEQSNISQKEIIEIFKNAADKLKFEVKEDSYVLTYDGDGKEFKELLAKQLTKTIGQNEEAAKEIIEGMNFKTFKAVYVLDKNTFEPREQKTDATFSLTSEGQTGDVEINSVIKFSNVNKVAPIKLPEEAKNAKEIENIN